MAIRTEQWLCGACNSNQALVQCEAINTANWKRDTYICKKCRVINHDKFIYNKK